VVVASVLEGKNDLTIEKAIEKLFLPVIGTKVFE